MSNQDDRNVRIRIAIDVPLGGAAPRIEMPVPLPAVPSQQPSPRLFSFGVVDRPSPIGYTKVRWVEAENTGYICAEGSTQMGSRTACAVFAKIFPGAPPSMSCIPPDVRQARILPYGTRWEFKDENELPGVIGSGGPHTLVVWFIYPTTQTWEWAASVQFNPVLTNETDCSGPSGGAATGIAAAGTGSSGPHDMHTRVAVAWKLTAAGFAGKPLSAFNGPWVLQLARPPEKGILFDNGGDGERQPRVELSTSSVCKPQWLLKFVLQGSVVQYSMPAENFLPQAANVFTQCSAVGILPEGAAAPLSVTITPA